MRLISNSTNKPVMIGDHVTVVCGKHIGARMKITDIKPPNIQFPDGLVIFNSAQGMGWIQYMPFVIGCRLEK